jgi:hypothetical protein
VRRERSGREAAVDEDDLDEPEASPRLCAAGEQALRRGRDVRPSALSSEAGERLLRALEMVGRIDHVRREHAGGLFGETRSRVMTRSANSSRTLRARSSAGALISSRRLPRWRSSSRPSCAWRSTITSGPRTSSMRHARRCGGSPEQGIAM